MVGASFLSLPGSLAALLLLPVASGFYLPGVYPRDYKPTQQVPLYVNSLTSTKTILPKEVYQHTFCRPRSSDGSRDDIHHEKENLGEFLSGDSIENSPYKIYMNVDSYCQQLCVQNLGRSSTTKEHAISGLIHNSYHQHWLLDNLPSAVHYEDSYHIGVDQFTAGGFPVGFVMPETSKAYVYNHVNIMVHYHPINSEDLSGKGEAQKVPKGPSRVVRFVVEPFSINHDFAGKDPTGTSTFDKSKAYEKVHITNASGGLKSCDESAEKLQHTTWEMAVEKGVGPQEAMGTVLFTYDVLWVESRVAWSSRWDIYLSMGGRIGDSLHWYPILNSLLIVLVLSGIVAAVLARALRRDLMRYNRLPTTDEEKAESEDDFGWKVIHADVFRPPPSGPLLLAVGCGTGLQVLLCSFGTVLVCAVGFISPAYRGGLIMSCLLFYVLMGGFGGYASARVYKTFKGKSWQRCTVLTATLYPGLFFATFFILNLVNWANGSTDAVPFTSMLVVVCLWFFVSTPLVFAGAYFGFKKDAVEFPTSVSAIPREIPIQPWYMSPVLAVAIGGLLPFGAIFVELTLILSSMWMDYYYYVFGFLILVAIILLLTSVEVAILFNYFQLCGEDYRWWWRSFFVGGSTAFYVFLYSVAYFQRLEAVSSATYCLYFGYMGAISVGVFLAMGSVGFLGCLYFNKIIYGSIKVD